MDAEMSRTESAEQERARAGWAFIAALYLEGIRVIPADAPLHEAFGEAEAVFKAAGREPLGRLWRQSFSGRYPCLDEILRDALLYQLMAVRLPDTARVMHLSPGDAARHLAATGDDEAVIREAAKRTAARYRELSR